MTMTDTLARIVDRLVQRFDPLRVILFGSRARGDQRPDSDIDLLVVLAECPDKRRAMIAMMRELRDFKVPVDVIVTTPEEIARRGHLVGTVLRPALREGRVLYDRA
jgi:predicted nucleotidyltransferase